MSRLAAVVLPLLLVLGFAPAPASAATINTTHATFRGWVNRAGTGGATYDTYPFDRHKLQGQCVALGNVGFSTYCEVSWSLFAGSPWNVCMTAADAGWVGYASYYQDGMTVALSADLIAVGAPGAATFEAVIPLGRGVLQLKIDAAAACAATNLLMRDPYAYATPDGFAGTAEYVLV